jgi:NDP-sugar pyrophosphorylase family protein
MSNKDVTQLIIQEMQVVILAGGRGTRLAPYTYVLPKPLMPLGEMPILEIVIRQLRKAGFRDITLAVGYLASLIEAYFGDGSRLGVNIRYSFETEPLGTAGPLSLVKGIDDTFLVMNGDLLTTIDYTDLIEFHKDRNATATVGVYEKDVKIDLGVVETDSKNGIISYIEKPMLSYNVSMGIYVMETKVLEYINPEEHLDLPELIRLLIAEGQIVIGYPFKGTWLDIGRQEDYAAAAELFANDYSTFIKD